MTVPPETITAAVQAAQAADQAYARLPASQRLREYEDLGWMRVGDRQVRRLLEAAAPLIAAAERDRLNQPGDGDPQFCQVCGADLARP
jgi:hypothetical protein